jgi:hypothetical protein
MLKRKGKIRSGVTTTTLLVLFSLLILLFNPINVSALSITKENVIRLTNQTRVDRGLNSLVEDSRLTEAAQNKAEDMINRGYWAHFYQGEKPWDWMERAGYNFVDAGENLAIDFVAAEDIHQAWLDSSSHRDNLLGSSYQDIGIGVAQGWFDDHNTIIVVQMFGRKSAVDQVQGTDSKSQADSQALSGEELAGIETKLVMDNQVKPTFKDRAQATLAQIGENAISFWSSLKGAGQSSIAWLNSKIMAGFSVSAD